MVGAPAPPKLLSIDDALALVAAHITPLPIENVALADSYGRFLAEDLRATIDLPPFPSSSMDGYALRATDRPKRLSVVGESSAGSPYLGALGEQEAVAISTGTVVPQDADAVVPLEDVVSLEDGSEIELNGAVAPGAFVRRRGSDIHRGAPLLATGTRLGSAQIGAAAAVGAATVACRRRPSVAFLTTGSELRQPGEALADGEIYDANAPMMQAALLTSGAVVAHLPAAADSREAHRAALAQALEHDVVVSSGGVSVGAHDLVRDIGAELGVREVFWRVALRPGRPLAFGVHGATLVFGLPGNPVSTIVCFELFVRPALLALQGAPSARPPWRYGSLTVAVKQNAHRDDPIRVSVGSTGVLSPLHGQESHQIAVAAQADAVALIPAGTGELPAGREVAYLPLQAF